MAKVIGETTTYHGTEHPYLRGYKVRIIAVLKNLAREDIDADNPEYRRIENDAKLTEAGGVTADDRLEVAPWIEGENRFSFVTSDPRAIDLAAFAGINRKGTGRGKKGKK